MFLFITPNVWMLNDPDLLPSLISFSTYNDAPGGIDWGLGSCANYQGPRPEGPGALILLPKHANQFLFPSPNHGKEPRYAWSLNFKYNPSAVWEHLCRQLPRVSLACKSPWTESCMSSNSPGIPRGSSLIEIQDLTLSAEHLILPTRFSWFLVHLSYGGYILPGAPAQNLALRGSTLSVKDHIVYITGLADRIALRSQTIHNKWIVTFQ